MNTVVLDVNQFKQLIVNGYNCLAQDYKRINDLNVFPVPDGDTGINMKKTLEGGVNAVVSLNDEKVGDLANSMSRGMIFSARGNSGVILSQFFKGFSIGLKDLVNLSVDMFTEAMELGVKQAYSAVNNPVEGTILTVMREASNRAKDSNVECFEDYFRTFLKEANESLLRTPELLPELKKAGVIDSGGAGFIKIFEGMALAIDGNILEGIEEKTTNISNEVNVFNSTSEFEFGYCTEFILQLLKKKVDIENFDIKIITDYLETIGNSIVAFKDEDIVKVHIHTFEPGKVIQYCQQFGEYITFKMENMSVQHSELSLENVIEKENVYIAVSNGTGISNQFLEMGVDYIVEGGQTMNPSTEDFISAFKKFKAKNIIVFPNNSNIIMTAKQSSEIYKDANVIVIPTKSIAQCYSGLSMVDYDRSINEQIEVIEEQINNVKTVEVTYSIRDCVIDNLQVKNGDYIAISEKKVLSVSQMKVETLINAIKSIENIDFNEVVTIIYGKDVTDDEISLLEKHFLDEFPWVEMGLINGGQDVYSFIVAVE